MNKVSDCDKLPIADIVTEVAQHPAKPIEEIRNKYGISGEEWEWILWACFPAINYRKTCVETIKMLDTITSRIKNMVGHWGEDVSVKKQMERELAKMKLVSEELWKNLDVKLVVLPEDEENLPYAKEGRWQQPWAK